MKKYIALFLIFPMFLCGASYEEEFIMNQMESVEESGLTDSLSDETMELLEKIGIDEIKYEELLSFSFKDFINLILNSAADKLFEPVKAVSSVIAAAIICILIKNFCENFHQTGPIINSVFAIAVSSAVLIPIKETFIYSSKIIEECSNFMLGFIPVYSSFTAASGYISSAAGYRTLMLGTVTAVTRLSSELVLPLIGIYLAMCIAGSVSDINIGEISKAFKNFSVWVLGITMTVFSCILGLGTLVSSSVDNSFSKTAKFLIGGTIPVVGGVISDAAATLKGCLILTKNIFGIYGIIVTLAVFIPPIISVIIWKICLSAASAISGIFENKNMSNLLSSASAVMGIILALLSTCGAMFIISVGIMLMTGGGM